MLRTRSVKHSSLWLSKRTVALRIRFLNIVEPLLNAVMETDTCRNTIIRTKAMIVL